MSTPRVETEESGTAAPVGSPSALSIEGQPWLAHYEAQVPLSITIPDLTLHALFEQTARDYPSHVATVFFGQRLTYSQLNDQADRFASALQQAGIYAGQRLAILLPNCPQFLVSLFGALKAGVVPVPIAPSTHGGELRRILSDSEATAAVTLSQGVQRLQEAQQDTLLRHIFAAATQDYLSPLMSLMLTVKERREGTASVQGGEGLYSFADMVRSGAGEYAPSPAMPGDTAMLLYTAGIAGPAVKVALSHRNLVANALQLSAWFWDTRPERHDVFLGLVPLCYSYSFATALLLPVAVAGTIVLLPRLGVKDALGAVARYRPTILSGTPRMYKALVEHPLSARTSLRCIRICISGETPLDPHVAEAFESVSGARLVQCYGLTETAGITHCNPVHGEARTGSIGLPLPSTEAYILDAGMRMVEPTGETGETGETGDAEEAERVGELAVAGPQIAAGASGEEDGVGEHPEPVWLFTGDLARMDEGGYFYLMARKADLITLGEHSFYPSEVEEALYTSPMVEDALVTLAHDPRKGEVVKAYVVLKADMEATERQLKSFLARRLPRYMVPTSIEFRETLPRNSSGKYQRHLLSPPTPSE